MKASTLSKFFLLTSFLLGGHYAHCEERFSVESWKGNFTTAVKENKIASAKRLLDFATLEKNVFSSCSDCREKETMNQARELFAVGKFDESRALYETISKSSPYWLDAIEEKGWTYFRQNRFDDVLSQTKTLLNGPFGEYVSSEAYFLQALTHLKACDYKDLFLTNTSFKEKKKASIMAIQNLSETGMNESFREVLAKVTAFPIRLEDVGASAKSLPYLFYKDAAIQRNILKYKISEEALKVLSLSSTPASQSLRQIAEKSKTTAHINLQKRMQILAERDSEENFKIIQKLNLVEVEAIQRLHFDMDMDKKLFKNEKFLDTSADQLVFVDDGNPWIDELDKYEVRSKYCPQNIRRKM